MMKLNVDTSDLKLDKLIINHVTFIPAYGDDVGTKTIIEATIDVKCKFTIPLIDVSILPDLGQMISNSSKSKNPSKSLLTHVSGTISVNHVLTIPLGELPTIFTSANDVAWLHTLKGLTVAEGRVKSLVYANTYKKVGL